MDSTKGVPTSPELRRDEESVPPSSGTPAGAAPASATDTTAAGEILTKADLERLGRQRPASLPSFLIEAGFVASIVGSMCMAEFVISGFNIILPSIVAALNIGESSATWPAGVPNLTIAAVLMPCARLCDRFGGRPVFLAGHAWLLVWSIAAGFAKGHFVLTFCRAMQGLGAGAFLPAGLALLGQTYRPDPGRTRSTRCTAPARASASSLVLVSVA
jgi:MFS family permease